MSGRYVNEAVIGTIDIETIHKNTYQKDVIKNQKNDKSKNTK